MDKLNRTWLTDNLIDFEYKKYILLSYIQSVKKQFRSNKLYPQLADLVMHYQNLTALKNNKEIIYDQFPKKLTGVDFDRLKLNYEEMMRDDELMNEISEIINYSLPQINKAISEGKNIHDFVEENVELDTIGLIPIYNKEGYMLLSQDATPEVKVYRYRIALFEHHKEQFRAINTTYIDTEVKSITNSAESIKMSLVKRFKELPNPATYLFNSKIGFPIRETYLPVAKRLLMQVVDVA
ncbi:MAG: hypothetical protein JXQ96_09765 [Cyclobacteriaceae bacterium]